MTYLPYIACESSGSNDDWAGNNAYSLEIFASITANPTAAPTAAPTITPSATPTMVPTNFAPRSTHLGIAAVITMTLVVVTLI